MKKIITTFALILSFSIAYSQEQTYNVTLFKNVEFPNVITIDNENLKLNGHGMHTEGISKLFVCGLYLFEKSNDPIKIIYDDHAKMIELVVTSNQFQSNNTIKEIKKVHKQNLDLMKSGELSDMVDNIKKYEGIIPQNLISVNNRFQKYFEVANKGNIDEIQVEIDTFLTIFDEEIKIGDHFRFSFFSDKITMTRNNEEKGEIEGKEFQKSLLNIFIGNLSFNNSLKEDLLAK